MSINVKISVPTYRANSWGQLDTPGEVEIISAVDILSLEYPVLKAQINGLLQEANAENRLALDLKDLERKCENKQRSLNILQDKINIARKQLRRMEDFLKRLGIDPASYTLMISEDIALKAASDESDDVVVEAEVDPIPFDSEANNNSYEF
jgi:hypothetical protein